MMGAKSEAARQYNRELHRETYVWYKDHGICTKCHTRYAEPGRTVCKPCTVREKAMLLKRDPGRERHKQYNRDRRARLKAEGLCTYCGKVKAMPGHALCKRCDERQAESHEKYRIKQRLKREAMKDARQR